MAHTRSHHRRLFPERSRDESAHAQWWQFGNRIVKSRTVALTLEREIQRQVRAARVEGHAISVEAVLESLPWDSVTWYVRAPRRATV